jgi:hypothetical protein
MSDSQAVIDESMRKLIAEIGLPTEFLPSLAGCGKTFFNLSRSMDLKVWIAKPTCSIIAFASIRTGDQPMLRHFTYSGENRAFYGFHPKNE